jgi:hypothetical protein
MAVVQYRRAEAEATGDQAAIQVATLAVFDAALHPVHVTGTNVIDLNDMLTEAAANIRAVDQTGRVVEEAQGL